MEKLPNLTESAINTRATAKTRSRAREYYDDGWVDNLIWRENTLNAEVEGSNDEPYEVIITFMGDVVNSTYCTCPYVFSGDCKHIIATLLTLIHQPDQIDIRQSLATILAPLSQQELISLVTELAKMNPHLDGEIEELIGAPAKSSVQNEAEIHIESVETMPTDTELKSLRRQIKADLRSAANSGYNDDYDYWDEDGDDLGGALEPGLSQAEEYLEQGHTQSALIVLEAITNGWRSGIDSLDEYYVDNYEDLSYDFVSPLGMAWAKTILLADLEKGERKAWRKKLNKFSESILGGESLEIAITALQQGWDYPPLRAVMEDSNTEQVLWEEDEAPVFADDLTLIRLEILEQRGEYDAYLNLAQAEAQFMRYLYMLIQLKQNDKALDEAQRVLNEPSKIHDLCITFVEQGESEKAIQLAQYGLKQEGRSAKARLAAWLSELAERENLPDIAFSAASEALNNDATLSNYLAVQKFSGDSWADIKSSILEQVAGASATEGKVDIYLHEGMHDEAIATFEQRHMFLYIDKMIEAVKDTHPRWAYQKCKDQADRIMDAGQSKSYDVAAEWVRRGRDILVAAGLEQEWRSYISYLLGVHAKKYKLIPMLRKLA